MKNIKIEKIIAGAEQAHKEGREVEKEFCKNYSNAAWMVISAYRKSVERGFDEIVIDGETCIFNNDVEGILNFCKEVGIKYFVYGSGFSGAMEVIMKMVEAGAKVGKFVVKEYKDNMFGEEKIAKVPGMRINL